MNVFLFILGGYLLGVLVSSILINPKKSYDAGYEMAKSIYTNWDKGYDAGWDNALRVLVWLVSEYKENYKEEN